jgi:hypothetical protein
MQNRSVQPAQIDQVVESVEGCNLIIFLNCYLGYTVSQPKIDPNLEKVSAITRMAPPESLQGMYKLTGCMASLSRFIS